MIANLNCLLICRLSKMDTKVHVWFKKVFCHLPSSSFLIIRLTCLFHCRRNDILGKRDWSQEFQMSFPETFIQVISRKTNEFLPFFKRDQWIRLRKSCLGIFIDALSPFATFCKSAPRDIFAATGESHQNHHQPLGCRFFFALRATHPSYLFSSSTLSAFFRESPFVFANHRLIKWIFWIQLLSQQLILNAWRNFFRLIEKLMQDFSVISHHISSCWESRKK